MNYFPKLVFVQHREIIGLVMFSYYGPLKSLLVPTRGKSFTVLRHLFLYIFSYNKKCIGSRQVIEYTGYIDYRYQVCTFTDNMCAYVPNR